MYGLDCKDFVVEFLLQGHGFELVVEAIRQVRGESTCQVDNVELSLVVAGPGYAPGSAALFGVDA